MHPFVTTKMDQTIAELGERLTSLLERNPPSSHRRILIALAGVPGSGKSTISAALVKKFSTSGLEKIAILPMVCYRRFP